MRLRQQLGASEVHSDPSGDFAVIAIATPSLQPDDLAALSRDFGEAISLQAQTVADLALYDHFRDGARARGLTYAGEAGWVRVVGDPEAWEASFFFAPARLDALIEELEEELDEATFTRDSAELRRLWSTGRLEEGKLRPSVNGEQLARAIAQQFGFAPPSLQRLSTSSQRAVR
jgi:hypothetical protein